MNSSPKCSAAEGGSDECAALYALHLDPSHCAGVGAKTLLQWATTVVWRLLEQSSRFSDGSPVNEQSWLRTLPVSVDQHAHVLKYFFFLSQDQNEIDLLCKNFRAQYNDNVEVRRRWGGGIMGIKSQHVVMKRERAIATEQAKKLGLAH